LIAQEDHGRLLPDALQQQHGCKARKHATRPSNMAAQPLGAAPAIVMSQGKKMFMNIFVSIRLLPQKERGN